jgi:transposase
VRDLGEIDNSPDAVRKLVAKLSRQYERLYFCYEAGPTRYGLRQQGTELGHVCNVVAPTMIPKHSGDRVKAQARLAAEQQLREIVPTWTMAPGWPPTKRSGRVVPCRHHLCCRGWR